MHIATIKITFEDDSQKFTTYQFNNGWIEEDFENFVLNKFDGKMVKTYSFEGCYKIYFGMADYLSILLKECKTLDIKVYGVESNNNKIAIQINHEQGFKLFSYLTDCGHLSANWQYKKVAQQNDSKVFWMTFTIKAKY